ncbi:unnamed protein product [Effrenium voratum]|uniref:Uncharacterized protein n=1 Tax=Effrenium voratum TaxID=2562239 RepID=A0AA36HSK5_9DINO|nr:unnamed protein product [Effrenium voratum]
MSCSHEGCSALAQVRRTFHSNAPWSLPALLSQRGLAFAQRGERALLAAWRPRASGPPETRRALEVDEEHRGVIELQRLRACGELGDKQRLALYLAKADAAEWAPRTLLSPGAEVNEPEQKLWFLKHARRERNEGVSVFLGFSACRAAWLSLHAEDYVAQQEVADLLLDDQGRKMTLRVYVLLLSGRDSSGSRRAALARREFVCRSHPAAYDANDPDMRRHVNSTLDSDKLVSCVASSGWRHANSVWPQMLEMFEACLGPFLSADALSRDEGLGFEVLGADVVVDRNLRPWLLEFNQGPALMAIKGKPEASAARKAVLEDVLKVVLDPVLQTGCLDEVWSTASLSDAWDVVAQLGSEKADFVGRGADIDLFRYELERMDASVQGTQRTVDRVVGELGRVQDVGDSLRADTEKRLCQQNKMLNVFKTDLEVKLVSLENRYNKLSDDVWGEETGLAKVMHDLSRTNEVVTSMSTEFSSMKHDKARESLLVKPRRRAPVES